MSSPDTPERQYKSLSELETAIKLVEINKPPVQPPSKLNIFSLPGEVRNTIYNHALIDSEVVYRPEYYPATENGPRAILLTNKKVRDEVRPIFLSICMFRINRLFMATVKFDVAARLRHITIDGSQLRLNSTVLRERFAQLRHLHIYYRPAVVTRLGSIAELKACKKDCCDKVFMSLLLNIIFFKEEATGCWISDFYGREKKEALILDKNFTITLFLQIRSKSGSLNAKLSSRDFVLHLEDENGDCAEAIQRAIKEDHYCNISEVPVVLPTGYHAWSSPPRSRHATAANLG